MEIFLTFIFKEFIPPVLLKFLRRRRFSYREFNTYQDALRVSDSYQMLDLIKLVTSKGVNFRKTLQNEKKLDLSSLRVCVALCTLAQTNSLIRVIDFGGAAGVHYFTARRLLPENIKLDWRIIETPALVAEAKHIGLESEELTFHSSDDLSDHSMGKQPINLVFASSSIHYAPDPYKVLKSLTAMDPDVLMITRTPFTDKPVVLLQRSLLTDNGAGDYLDTNQISNRIITYPVTMLDKEKVESL
jgi:putative methyltransferase (TIGR04325 family)